MLNITPIKRNDSIIDIFVDVYTEGAADNNLVAKPVSFRFVRPYDVDEPCCGEKGPLLSMTPEKAKEFAEEILKIVS